MKYFSMFSGIGGFELGIKNAWENITLGENSGQGRNKFNNSLWQNKQCPSCIGYSELNKYAIQVYEKYFKGHKNYGDATRIIPEQLPDFDFLCGGFPCQAFSIAGKRGGFKDTRGTLFFEIARILSVKRPKLLLLENVKGLLSHDNGRTFGTILAALSELGYFCEWQVLNSKDFGVPQNRERVFIVGHLGESGGREVFPITNHDEKDIRLQGQLTTNCLKARYEANGDGSYVVESKFYAPNGKEIDISNAPTKPFQLLETRTELGKETRREIRRKEGRDSTMRGKEDKKYIPKIEDIANCLTTGKENIEKWLFEGNRIRRLTPTECERLQGFPDGWTDILSDSQRYKCLGNAVTTNVISAIISKMVKESE